MFIKIIKIVRSSNEGKRQKRESVYECDNYHLTPVEGTSDKFEVAMDRAPELAAVVFTYSTSDPMLGIYVMNNEGQTIDVIFRS